MISYLPDDARVMPETRPDDAGNDHKVLCNCAVCRRPEAVQRKMAHIRTQRKLAYLKS